MQTLPAPLEALGTYKQFIIFLLSPSKTRVGKTDKFPADFRTGRVASAHDPQYWTDAATAMAAAATFGHGYGVGFVFTELDPFWFLDIDSCLLPDNSDWSPLAKGLVGSFPGAAVEVSQSGRGLHIFGTGRPPPHSCKNTPLALEFYHSDRFVALTGLNATGDARADFTNVLPALVAQYFPPDEIQAGGLIWTDTPCPEWRGSEDDNEIVRRALRSHSPSAAFGNRASFADLWTKNVEVLAIAYHADDRPYDESSADAALAQHLAFWTGKNPERIRRMMYQSALVRDKWEREDYLPRTIMGAIARQFDVLTDKTIEPVAHGSVQESSPVAAPRPKMVEGATFVGNEQQLALFNGCVYIQDIHRVLIPGGIILKPEQFKVHFGGYTFTMDNANEKTTKDAWEAFTQNQAFRAPRVNSAVFRPDLAPAQTIEQEGMSLVNTYWPVVVVRKVGNVKPFLDHLAKVLPDQRDRNILLYYMAACVQHKGVKFQWAPLLQGVEGNGKTLFTRCVSEAVGRRYVHFPPAQEIQEKFNSWLFNTIFIGVEDIYVPDQKREVIEILKPMITGDKLAKRAMQTDQIMAEVVANFMFNSNHKDAVRKTQNDRRFCVFFSAQQQVEDLKRDGMGGDYFPKLYDWLRKEGYAIVSELLHTIPIPNEFNPATHCQRAPVTTSTASAISASAGGVEQEIHEAIAQGTPGFCGGWVSSMQLDKMLERMGASRRVTHSKRKEMLDGMGYVYHPAFTDGRVNNVVTPDGGKPRLFVLKVSQAYQIQNAAEASKDYEKANMGGHRLPFPLVAG